MPLLLAWLLLTVGCGEPRISADAFELTKVFYTVCNQRSAQQLPRFRELLDERRSAGLITQAEQQRLQGLATLAERGDWKRASARARRLLEAQNQPASYDTQSGATDRGG